MNILPYQLAITNDLITSRAGLVCLAHVMQRVGFSQKVQLYFPQPNSNRGFPPSVFVNSIMLMLHEGGKCLEDIRHIRNDSALRCLLGLKHVPTADALGNWLRRCAQQGVQATTHLNRHLLNYTLHNHKQVTLDIDATLCPSHNKQAQWTYKKCTGYMPMVGHIAETGQIVATDFRHGNVSPATGNLEFIRRCEHALPQGVSLKAVRIDAAGYQANIVDMCVERKLKFAIRAKMTSPMKQLILRQPEANWKPLLNAGGHQVPDETILRLTHTMDKSRHAFEVVVQRRRVMGQHELGLEPSGDEQTIHCGAYIYRAIAVSALHHLNDSDWVYWYNQRGEDSENRIKELKSDVAAARLPCSDFEANAFYFALCALAYNLLALLRMVLPTRFESSRARTLRWRLYGLAAKVVRHGRKVFLKLAANHHAFLAQVLSCLQRMGPAP